MNTTTARETTSSVQPATVGDRLAVKLGRVAQLPALLAKLRPPDPTTVVTVNVSGHPKAVTALTRALSTVADITAMTHQIDDGAETIRLELTCIQTMAGGGR
jgi:hypothetical protein